MQDKGLSRAVADQRRAGHLRLDQLEDVLERFPRAPGTRRLRQRPARGRPERFPRAPGTRRLRPLLAVPNGGLTRSELEDKVLAFGRRFGLPEAGSPTGG